KRIVSMPGVPREMTYMWEHHIEPTLIRDARLRSRTLKILGVGESQAEETLAELVRSTAPTVVTKAKDDGLHIRITDKDADPATMDRRIAAMEKVVRERLGRYVWGTDDDTLGSVVGAGLEQRGWRLATAEALSAGDVSRVLTHAPRANEWFMTGVVIPHATAESLARAIEHSEAQVRLLVPHGDASAEITVT